MKKKSKRSGAFDAINKFVDSITPEEKENLSQNLLGMMSYKADRTISTDEWRSTHPDNLTCPSDAYYTKLVNRMVKALNIMTSVDLPTDTRTLTAISSAAYLEDLINNFGVWNAIRTLYRRDYGTWLPFYDCEHEGYLLDNVNIEDLKFIAWQSLSRCGIKNETVYSPYSTGVEKMASVVYDIIVDEFEHAPESQRIATYIDKKLSSGDYYDLREIARWINLDNPLTCNFVLKTELAEKIKELIDDRNFPAATSRRLKYSAFSLNAWSSATGALGCPTSQWISALAQQRGLDSIADKTDGIKNLPVIEYRIKSVTDSIVELEDIVGNVIPLQRNSIGEKMSLDGKKGYAAKLAYFDGEWLQNGAAVISEEFEPSRPAISSEVPEHLRKAINDVIDRYNGEMVFVFKNIKKLEKFAEDNSLLPANIVDNGEERIALLLSRKDLPVTIFGGAKFFKLKDNKMYSAEDSEQDGLMLLKCNIPDDAAKYIQDNNLCPNVSIYTSQGPELGHRIMRENFRFYCAFYRMNQVKAVL